MSLDHAATKPHERLAAVLADEMAAVNARLGELGLDTLDPWDENTAIWAPEGL